jgi:hypothetical protein
MVLSRIHDGPITTRIFSSVEQNVRQPRAREVAAQDLGGQISFAPPPKLAPRAGNLASLTPLPGLLAARF